MMIKWNGSISNHFLPREQNAIIKAFPGKSIQEITEISRDVFLAVVKQRLKTEHDKHPSYSMDDSDFRDGGSTYN